MRKKMVARWAMGVFMGACVCCGIGAAEVYQYQDSQGNWIFTDTPPPDADGSLNVMDGMVNRVDGVRDLKSELEKAQAPENGVAASALATVTVRSAIGIGSGFFISENGFLLTNRHVIWGDTNQGKAMENAIDQAEDRISAAEREFELNTRQLALERETLTEMETVLEKLPPGSAQRESLRQQYQSRMDYYQNVKKSLDDKQADFERQKTLFRSEKSDYESRQARAGVSRNFEITLKTGESLQAWLVRASEDHDLALLKVDGCKTPYIPAVESSSAAQQLKVFAIGSPLNFADTIQNGIVTGFSGGFIQTNARIYPGNSGGPLVDEAGQVIGINTFKELTRNFEGMGFAIPIRTALEEFAGELR